MSGAFPRRVAVTGIGAVSPLGLGARKSWHNLLQGHIGITVLGGGRLDFSKNDSRVAGLVPRGPKAEGKWQPSEWLRRDDERKLARFMQYALVASQEALEDARWLPANSKEQETTGVCIGSGIGAFEDIYDTSLAFRENGPKKVSPYFVPKLLINLAAGHISMKYGFKGPNHAATTACTTGAHSIGDAARFIQVGDADVMIAGGAESCIHPLAFTGFERSRSLITSANDEPQNASRPFDESRDGFVMAEGAAILVLEELQHAFDRGAKIYALFSGYGASADGFHITQPPHDGNGAFRAMQRALQQAGLRPSNIDYINAHATSTKIGDIAEARAIFDLLHSDSVQTQDTADVQQTVVGGTKGATGHLLGAAGALEAVFSVLAVSEGRIPGMSNLSVLDPLLPPLNFARLPDQRPVNAVLSNSFGFGGTNASLCFTKHQHQR